MLPDRALNPGPLTYESGDLPIALRGPASCGEKISQHIQWVVRNVVSSLVLHFVFCSVYTHMHKEWMKACDGLI